MQSLQAGVTGRMPVSFQCTRPKHGVRGGTPICSGAEGTGASRPRTTPVSRATPAQKNRGGADPKPWETDQLPQGRRVLQPAEPLMASIDDPSFGRPINPSIDREELSRTVRAVILAGGEAKNPLTRSRAMPAVPLGSSLMMIDVPISNCMSAGINKIYVLTQFQSHTLNSHLTSAYPPVRFGGPDHQAWVDVLAAQQTVTEKDWYQGSADAVRRNINELMDEARGVTPATEYVILSGAAVYTMDVAQLVAEHRAKGADITIAMHPVSEADASGKGVAKVHNSSNRVLKFEEKPSKASLEGMRREGVDDDSRYLANMGVYVFRREALFRLLSPAKKQAITHIGHHVVPNALAQEMKVYAYLHDGYWHDVSSLKDFYETNLDLSDEDSPIKSDMSVAARGSMLPPAQLHDADITRTIVGDGAVLVGLHGEQQRGGRVCVHRARVRGGGLAPPAQLLLGQRQAARRGAAPRRARLRRGRELPPAQGGGGREHHHRQQREDPEQGQCPGVRPCRFGRVHDPGRHCCCHAQRLHSRQHRHLRARRGSWFVQRRPRRE
ncbi:hypothetical protein ACKKBF_B37900 [Auxenochlorella protothecoides x Auxenochlorella symbiontica]